MKETYECKLSGTETCAVLHMGSCERCPLNTSKSDNSELIEDVKLFRSLVPEEGLYSLFETDECKLCTGEVKGKKAGYAIFDMAHPEPKRLHRKGWLFGGGKFGFIAPLQFAVCKKCRRRLLALDYMPIVSTVALTAIALCFVISDTQRRSLNSTSLGLALPLIIVAGSLLLGFILGKVLQGVLKKRWGESMTVDITSHPFIKKMEERGWFPLLEAKKGKVVFSRKMISNGLGTAPKAAYFMLDNEDENC
ncbi:MAG: hypothetical protein Q4C04_07505 [Clostridia bacterium]|nr:hypothetical protein [Clostridia bacterium]